MNYEAFRQFADSWGLVMMGVAWTSFVGWAFLPRNRDVNRQTAELIFKDGDHE